MPAGGGLDDDERSGRGAYYPLHQRGERIVEIRRWTTHRGFLSPHLWVSSYRTCPRSAQIMYVCGAMSMPAEERARLVRIRRMTLASRLRALREARGWSQETLARRAGVDRSFYADLELGNHSPRVDLLWDIAAAYGVPISDLFRE